MGLGQDSPRISGGGDKMRTWMGQLALDPVLWRLAKIQTHSSLIYTGSSPKPCTKHIELLRVCLTVRCAELCLRIEGTGTTITCSGELVRASLCLQVVRVVSHTLRIPTWHLPGSRVEGCSSVCHSRELPPSGRSVFYEISHWDVPETCLA